MNADSREVVERLAQFADYVQYDEYHNDIDVYLDKIVPFIRQAIAALSTPPPPEPLSREGVARTVYEAHPELDYFGEAAEWEEVRGYNSSDPPHNGLDAKLAYKIADAIIALAQTHPVSSPADDRCFECDADLIGPLCPKCNPLAVSSPGEGWREAAGEAIECAFREGWYAREVSAEAHGATDAWLSSDARVSKAKLSNVSASPAQPARQPVDYLIERADGEAFLVAAERVTPVFKGSAIPAEATREPGYLASLCSKCATVFDAREGKHECPARQQD